MKANAEIAKAETLKLLRTAEVGGQRAEAGRQASGLGGRRVKGNAEILKAETRNGCGSTPHPTLSPIEAERGGNVEGTDLAVRLRKATPEQIKLIEQVLAGGFPAAVMVAKADGFMDRKELTEHLKISIRCLEEWQRRGVLPFIKIGRIILFHWPDVVEHLRRHYRVANPRLDGESHHREDACR